MRILQIVSIISDRGIFGGPASVAQEQVKSLRARGHQVDLVGASPSMSNKSPNATRLFYAFKIAPYDNPVTYISPGLFLHVLLRGHRYAHLHVHFGRDLISLTVALAALACRRPYILQCHGMIMPDARWPVRVLDAIITRPILRHARSVLYLTDREKEGINKVEPSLTRLNHVVNGVAEYRTSEPDVVTESSEVPVVLYCARLEKRKRPLLFAEAAKTLIHEGRVLADFRVVGPDQGELQAFREYVKANFLEQRVSYMGALTRDSARAELAAADIYVLPSVDEPFPMSVLEAMSAGTATIITTSCGLAGELDRASAALVVAPDARDLSDAIGRLLSDSTFRHNLGAEGKRYIEKNLSAASVAVTLENLYLDPRRHV